MVIIVVYIYTSENTKNEIYKFYNTPEIAKYQSKSQGIIIIMVQAKAQDSEMIVVKYGSCNKRRKKLVDWCVQQ